MRPGGGKSKGAQFERDVCRELSLWVSSGKQEDVFWRSAVSGGRSTVARKSGKQLKAQAGDISCIHPLGHTFSSLFYVECKHYNDLGFAGLVTGMGHLIEFWYDTKEKAESYGKHPLLIAKQNRIPAIACFDEAGGVALCLDAGIIVPEFELRITKWVDWLNNANKVSMDFAAIS